MGKSVYRWISHKRKEGLVWRAAIRGNTNRPTLFQLQSWRGSHHSLYILIYF
jgi:hypothetical protein